MYRWTTQTTSYWGSPSGATYKVVKHGVEWAGFRYGSGGKWFKICSGMSKTEAQEKCEAHEKGDKKQRVRWL